MSGFSWDLRIARARELLKTSLQLLNCSSFYQRLARFQKTVYEADGLRPPIMTCLCSFLICRTAQLVKESGSADLKAAAATLEQSSPEDRLELLRAVWQHEVESHELPPESVFFANALLQPFAEYPGGEEHFHH